MGGLADAFHEKY